MSHTNETCNIYVSYKDKWGKYITTVDRLHREQGVVNYKHLIRFPRYLCIYVFLF